MEIGILGYGVYIPKYRITADEYSKAWGTFSVRGISEKAVTGYDEDIVTMAVEAALNALKSSNVDPTDVNAFYLSSTSGPYTEKLLSSTISTVLGLPANIMVADYKASTKAGTTAMLTCMDIISSGRAQYGLVVASDYPQARPGDTLEHASGAGAAAFMIGKGKTVATFEETCTVASEVLGERFRRNGERFVEDLGITSYTRLSHIRHITSTVKELLKRSNKTPEDFHYIVMQQFDGREPYRIARRLGFKDSQVRPGMIISTVGDTGASSPLLGLAAVLEKAKVGERVLVVSYGSGAGSDALSIDVQRGIEEVKNRAPMLQDYLTRKVYIDYVTYLKLRKMVGS